MKNKLVVLFAIVLCSCAAAVSKYSAFMNGLPDDARGVAYEVLTKSKYVSQLENCPADIYRPNSNLSKKTKKTACEADISKCFSDCKKGDARSCFYVASAFQSTYEESAENFENAYVAFPLYMESCALGLTNGCTNAAATVRWGDWPDNIRPRLAATDDCARRSFLVDCTDDRDSWGCRMLRRDFPDAVPAGME